MSYYKDTIEELTEWFKTESDAGTVTFGDIGEVDVSSITDFPLVHIVPVTNQTHTGYSSFVFDIYILDIKEELDDPIEPLDIMADISIKFSQYINNTSGADIQAPAADVVYDQFSNRLFGFKIAGLSIAVRTILC